MKSLILVAMVSVLAACSSAPKPVGGASSVASPEILYIWSQWVPGAEAGSQILQARAIANGPGCPTLVTDKGSIVMSARGGPMPEFPQLACEAAVPVDATTAHVEFADGGGDKSSPTEPSHFGSANQKLELKIPARKMARIVVIGDTGCRLKAGAEGRPGAYQDCNDPKAWPFASVAAAAAKHQPDLVIHLGDIHYRESPCPAVRPGCQGAATGFAWPAWEQDFFQPAKPLLQAAPWIIVRGNHESCARAGVGWSRFLEPKFGVCRDDQEPYSLKFGSHELVIMDSAEEANMVPSFQKLQPRKRTLRWLLLHRPFLTANADKTKPTEALLPEVLKKPGQVSLAMVGHIHVLSLNHFADHRPPELIIGNSGTALQGKVDYLLPKKGDELHLMNEFGFVVLEQVSVTSWKLTAYNPDGAVLKNCRIKESYKSVTSLKCDGTPVTLPK